MKWLIYPFLIFMAATAAAQTCEQFDRKLFRYLSTEVPDSINCKDATGKKQGWWIYYHINYNPAPLPDELDSGYYVGEYTYGKYHNDKPIGKWAEVYNVHLIYEHHIDSFYYNKDTMWMQSWFNDPGYDEKTTMIVGDSAVIDSRIIKGNDTIHIYCNSKKGDKACKLVFRGKTIERFPKKDLSIKPDIFFALLEEEKMKPKAAKTVK